MKIELGEPAERYLREVSWPAQTFATPIQVTGLCLVRVSACNVRRPDTPDVLGAWNDPYAQLRVLHLDEGETVILQPTGQGVVYTPYPVVTLTTPVASGGPTSTSGLSVTVPTQLESGMIVAFRQFRNVYYPYTVPWLFKSGSMFWNLGTDPSLAGTIVDPAMTFNSPFLAGPNYSNAPGAQSLSSGTPSIMRFWNNGNPFSGLPLADSGDDISRPFWVSAILPGDTSFINTIMFGVTEIAGAFATQFITGVLPNNLVDLDLTLNTLFTMILRPRPAALSADEDTFSALIYVPKWTLTAGNILVFFWAVDYANGAISDRVGGGYAPKAFRLIGLGRRTYSQPVLSGQPTLPSNLQPL